MGNKLTISEAVDTLDHIDLAEDLAKQDNTGEKISTDDASQCFSDSDGLKPVIISEEDELLTQDQIKYLKSALSLQDKLIRSKDDEIDYLKNEIIVLSRLPKDRLEFT